MIILQRLEKEFKLLKNKLGILDKDLQAAKKVISKEVSKNPIKKTIVASKAITNSKKSCGSGCKKSIAAKPKTVKTIVAKKKTKK